MPEPVKIPLKVLEAYQHLFITTRTFLELAEPVSEDESMVNTDNLEDLNAAYLEVYRQKNLAQEGKGGEER